MKRFNPISSILPGILVLGASGIHASTVNAETSYTADTVVVTANRTAKTVNDTISSVAVITEDDIQRSQARSVPELLQGLAGLYFTNNGGRGKPSSLFIRGANSDHVVVLIDGIKVGSATLGTVPFQNLPVDHIERIEVVRGARSSLYGSEAIGGVIQIFTRKNTSDVNKFLNVSVGAQDTYEGSAGVSGGNNGTFYNLSATGVTTSGFDSCKKEANGVGGCYNDEPDGDGYESFSGNIRIGHEFSNGSQISISGQQTQNKNEFDGDFQNSSESMQTAFGAAFDWVLSDNYVLKVTAGQSRDNSDNFINDVLASKFNTQIDTVNLQNDFQLDKDVLLTFGGDYQRDEVSSTTAYPVTERENMGGFFQASADYNLLNIEASVRHDENEQYGSHKTFGAGIAAKLNRSLQLVSSFGTAFKAPTFNQLYFPYFGSPNLKPEESRNAEIGIRAFDQSQNFSLTFFKTEIDHLIVYDSSIWAANNIDRAKIKGFELAYGRQLNKHWSASADFTLMNPVNTSANHNGNLLPRRAKQTARIDVNYAKQDWMLGATINMVGGRYDDAGNTRALKAYRTVDLRVSKELNPEWQLQARLTNLTDTDYETAEFYNQQERSLLFTLRYRPE